MVYGRPFYEDVADAVTAFLPPSLRDFQWYRTNANLKLWYTDDGREHYEVQLLKRNKRIVLEIGFHAEHKDSAKNEEALDKLRKVEKRWRKPLGTEAECGEFIGHQSGSWRRLSELWDVTDDPELAVDAAARLADYIRTLEPIRNGTPAKPSPRTTPERSGGSSRGRAGARNSRKRRSTSPPR